MIVVTLLAVGGGYVRSQVKFARKRAFAAANQLMLMRSPVSDGPHDPLAFRGPCPLAPWPFCCFGEPGYGAVVVAKEETDEERAELVRLFPEAKLIVAVGDVWTIVQ